MKRDLRRAMRLIFIPLLLILGLFSFLGSLSPQGDQAARSPTHQLRPQTSTSQATDANSATHYVTGNRVNQRSGPGIGNSVMGALTKGTPVREIGAQDGWTQIASPLGTGWMSSRYLSPQAPTRLSKATHGGRIVRVNEIRVIDGDTVSIRGERANVRLVGFNTPETYKPSCSAERAVGQRATARLGELLRSANVIEFEGVTCSCRSGTHGTSSCNFGRQCGSLYVDGTDVGRILISEALAERYVCGRTSCPRRQASWCR